MSLELDARQRAMLAEMGVPMFQPLRREVPQDSPAVVPPARAPMPQPQRIALQEAPPKRAAPAASAPLAGGIELMEWDALAQAVSECRACVLCQGRKTVFGAGDRRADWLIVGDAPTEEESEQGEPFLGQAGKLLDNMLKALGLDRQRNVYITNALKCCPPGHRNPEPQEVAQCEPFLRRQVQLLQPKIILAMGRFAVQSLLGTDEAIGKLRGRRHEYMGVPLVVTYHPAYLLRNLPDKAKAWADLCLALEVMGGPG